MKLFLLFILLSIQFKSYSQSVQDTFLISQVVNLQLRIAEEEFGEKFYLLSSSLIPDGLHDYNKPSDEYGMFICGEILNWEDFSIHTNMRVLDDDSAQALKMLPHCYISTPMFNPDKTRCRIAMVSSYGEWGASARYYYYRKRMGRWKLIRHNLIWIS